MLPKARDNSSSDLSNIMFVDGSREALPRCAFRLRRTWRLRLEISPRVSIPCGGCPRVYNSIAEGFLALLRTRQLTRWSAFKWDLGSEMSGMLSRLSRMECG